MLLSLRHLSARRFSLGVNHEPHMGNAGAGGNVAPPPVVQQSGSGDISQLLVQLSEGQNRLSQALADQAKATQQTVAGLQGELQTVRQSLTQPPAASTPAPQAPPAASQQYSQQADRMFGGAPGVRIGEDPLSSRGFSYAKAWGLRCGTTEASEAKVEHSFSEKLTKFYQDRGFAGSGDRFAVLVPLSADYLPAEIDQTFREEVRQSMNAGPMSQMSPDEARWAQKRLQSMGNQQNYSSLSQWRDDAMGIFVGPAALGELIPLLRNQEAFSRAGATEFALPPNGRMVFPRQTGTGTAFAFGETPADVAVDSFTSSNPTTGSFTMQAKGYGHFVTLPNELMRFGGPLVEAFIRADMAAGLSLKTDLDGLQGAGNDVSIKGLINYAGVNSIVATTTAANGNTFEPKDIDRMESELEDDNHDTTDPTCGFLLRYRMLSNILGRRAGGYAANDGNYLFQANRDQISNGLPRIVHSHRVTTTNQISNARIKGSGTDLTYILLGVFKHWFIGRVGVMEFAIATQGSEFRRNQSSIRAIQYIDMGPRYENAFCWCDQIDMDLPA